MSINTNLTEGELKAALILVKSCLDGMGGTRPIDLDNDPYTWVDVQELMRVGYSRHEAAGYFSSLREKGFIEGEPSRRPGDGLGTCLSDEAYRYLDTVWDANKNPPEFVEMESHLDEEFNADGTLRNTQNSHTPELSAQDQIAVAFGDINTSGSTLAHYLGTSYEDIMCARGAYLDELIERAKAAKEEYAKKRLRDAAPELLEALREIETICTESAADCRKRMGTRVGNALVVARAAIARATKAEG